MKNKVLIRSPNGFRVQYRIQSFDKRIESVYCELIDQSKPNHSVGHVELAREDNKGFVTHAQLYSEYHGRGLGNLLYSKAIAWALNNGYRVRSSGDSSHMAKRVWSGKGIRKLFKIRKSTDRFGGYSRETWYATNKPKAKRSKKK